MRNGDCAEFLKWALPKLDLRWPGFRKVRGQVCKRLRRRLDDLGLASFAQYRRRLAADASEWAVLDGFCRITISRLYRDKRVFDVLGSQVLPDLAAGAGRERRSVRCWCAGCASGEEVYTLRILWDVSVRPRHPGVAFQLLGTDADPVMIERAHRGCFSAGSLSDVPEDWLARAFEDTGGLYCVKDRHRTDIAFSLRDLRAEMPHGPFDLVLCRNVVFTYFAADLQRTMLDRIRDRLRDGGFLVIGAHEDLPGGEGMPSGDVGFRRLESCREIWRKCDGQPDSAG